MTTDSHTRSLKESRKGLKENAKENGMSQMEVDKEFLEIREGLSNLMRLLLKEEENQSLEWILRRKVRQPVQKLLNRTLKQKINVWLKPLDIEHKFKDIEQGSQKMKVTSVKLNTTLSLMRKVNMRKKDKMMIL